MCVIAKTSYIMTEEIFFPQIYSQTKMGLKMFHVLYKGETLAISYIDLDQILGLELFNMTKWFLRSEKKIEPLDIFYFITQNRVQRSQCGQ